MASRPETILKMKKAQDLLKQGKTLEQVAKILNLSTSRIREYQKGINWYSKEQLKKPIK